MEIANMIKIETLELSVRTSCCLNNMGITCLAQLTDITENELLKCKNFGLKSLYEIIDILIMFGLTLKNSKYQTMETLREKYIN